jgi:simple sugar transport system permease protein
MPFMHDALAALGIRVATSPLNLSLVLATTAVRRLRAAAAHALGYAMRTVGHNPEAARYAASRSVRTIMQW